MTATYVQGLGIVVKSGITLTAAANQASLRRILVVIVIATLYLAFTAYFGVLCGLRPLYGSLSLYSTAEWSAVWQTLPQA